MIFFVWMNSMNGVVCDGWALINMSKGNELTMLICIIMNMVYGDDMGWF